MKYIKIYFLAFILSCFTFISCVNTDRSNPNDPLAGNFKDAVPPSVVSTVPANNAIDVPNNRSLVATVSEDIDTSVDLETVFVLRDGTAEISGTVLYSALDKTLTFTPDTVLEYPKTYTAAITTNLSDESGNHPLAEYAWAFVTAAGETTPPVVQTTYPSSGAENVPVDANITVTFNEGMTLSTINSTNFFVKQSGTTVPGVVTYDSTTKTATFNPSSDMFQYTVYTVTVTTGVTDLSNNALAAEKNFSFTTIDSNLPTGSISISSGAAATASAAVNLTISAADGSYSSGIYQMMVSNNADFSGGIWETYSTTTYTSGTWTLAGSSTQGTKTVYIKFKDNAGNESAPYSDTILLDLYSPAGSVYIEDSTHTYLSLYENGSSYPFTGDLVIAASDTIGGTGSGVTQMKVSRLSDLSDADWIPYSTSYARLLLVANAALDETDFGSKTAYVRFRDAVGRESATYSDSIYIDDGYEGYYGNNTMDDAYELYTTTDINFYGTSGWNHNLSDQEYELGLPYLTTSDAVSYGGDWYKMYIPYYGDAVYVTAVYSPAYSNLIRIRVYDADGIQVAASSATSTTTASWSAAQYETYYIQVDSGGSLLSNTAKQYDLRWEQSEGM